MTRLLLPAAGVGAPGRRLELDFIADDPGRTLFHCHQQLQMDFDLMALFDSA